MAAKEFRLTSGYDGMIQAGPDPISETQKPSPHSQNKRPDLKSRVA